MDNEEVKRRRLASAEDFRTRGLVLVPMHPVLNGECKGWHKDSSGVWRMGGTCTHKPGKHPAGKWSPYRDAGTPNHLWDLHKWVGRDQNLGVLMDCGALRVWVADCDTPEALDYVESVLGKTPCVVETGRDGGGWHLYYLLPAGVTMATDNGKSFPGLDIKTSGYVIAPWGRHHSGRVYTPHDWFDLSQAPIADPHLLKPVLVSSVTPGGATVPKVSGATFSAAGTSTTTTKQLRLPREEPRWYYYGQRNDKMYDAAYRYRLARRSLLWRAGCIQGKRGRRRLFRYTCDLVRWYLMDADQTLRLLTEFNALNEPPFSSQELSDAVDAAFVLGTWSERGRLSYQKAHAREKAKSVQATKRRSVGRAEQRGELWVDLKSFLTECCVDGDEAEVTATELWTAFSDFAPWVGSDQRVRFGRMLEGVLMDVFSRVERKRGHKGFYFSGLRLEHDYLEHCAQAA